MKKILVLFSVLMSAFMVSCSTDFNVQPSVDQIILTADSSTKLTGETITFSITNNLGQDLTGEAAIFVDGVAITSNTYSSNTVGTHQVTATYFSVASEPLVINFHDGSEINFVKRVLIEDYTGTWCGYCPRVAQATDLVHNLTDNVVPVSIHRVSSNPSDPSYDPYNYDTTVLEDLINVPGYPKGMLNRSTQWTYPEPSHVNQAIALTQGENPKVGFAMSSTVNGNNFTLTVNAKFAKTFTNLKLVVYVLENGLIHDQYNYTTYFGGQNPIPNYVHNHVLRAALTPLLGDTVPDSETDLGHTYSRTFSVAFPSDVVDPTHVEFVSFLLDANNNVINSRKAAVSETQDFEQL
jgi:thiol-disulfide isomerase/thioredoxin